MTIWMRIASSFLPGGWIKNTNKNLEVYFITKLFDIMQIICGDKRTFG